MGVFEALYDPIMIPADWFGVKAWREWAASVEGKRILELGIGTGLNLPYYRRSAAVFAIDSSWEMLERAEARAGKMGRLAALVQARAEELPFREAIFDAAVVTMVLCTVEDMMRSLEELRRVLRPHAPVRMVEHVRLHDGAGARIQDALTPGWKRIAGGCNLNRDTLEAVKTAGFEVIRVEEHALGIFLFIEAAAPNA